MKEKITKYILEEILGNPEEELLPDDDLLNSGMIDSLGIMRVISFIEGEYDMKVPPQDMVIENFISVSAIAAYIQKVKST
ncbi:acyl carrier protein [Roseivirga sp.]|uniref:acyl carrier protein n=1 Tax=Roseivirga sp. TaxID=1964215 RepID=UPI003B8CB7A4